MNYQILLTDIHILNTNTTLQHRSIPLATRLVLTNESYCEQVETLKVQFVSLHIQNTDTIRGILFIGMQI